MLSFLRYYGRSSRCTTLRLGVEILSNFLFFASGRFLVVIFIIQIMQVVSFQMLKWSTFQLTKTNNIYRIDFMDYLSNLQKIRCSI